MRCRVFGLLFIAALAVVPALADVTWWVVPAMSGVQRLPDAVPADGELGGTVRIVAARGEYEPGSFVVRSAVNLGKVQPVVGKLVNEKGDVFPADNLDLTVVKVWYQNKNGWFSYFADTGMKLCPELLLHDEDLIRVDTAKKANYARITSADGKTAEWWLNPPQEKKPFPSMRPGFADARTIQPVALEKGISKQFFLTAHVTPDIPAGIYRGSIVFPHISIPVAIKVLDFDLPKPMAYIHPEMDMRICSYDYIGKKHILELNGGDEELAWKQMEAILADFVAHGQDMKWVRCKTGSEEAERTIELMKKVGMRTDVLVGPVDYKWQERDAKAARERADGIVAYYNKKYGHHNVYCGYGDEPGMRFFPENRPVFDAYQAAGLKFIIASHEHIFDQAGFRWDWHNAARNPADATDPSVWNQMGTNTYCAWYANQHVGAENPELNRRQNGLAAYLSGYSALCNYAHHLGPYNDVSETYKPMAFVYGTADGVIDTIQWEGFREGVDDIRYATLMLSLAREAEASADVEVRHLAGKAKLLLARFDKKTGDLNAARGEMTCFIERLRAALDKGNGVKAKCGQRNDAGVVRRYSPPLPSDISWVQEGPREGLAAPKRLPEKMYLVSMSPVRILGLGSWDAAAKVAKPRTEKLDRGYGGDASCLWTDVATQRGTVKADADKRYARAPEWQAMADEWGLHFRLEVFDEKAAEIAQGFAAAGSLEAYLAPGENTPYYAFLHSFETGGLAIYNPAYSQVDHREIDEKDRANCREEVMCTAESVVLYFAISWKTFATRIPTAESVWEFEPMFWGRKGNCSWNGLRTIHGRSTWGRLRFAFADADRRRILRPVIAAACKAYKAEKRPTGGCGRWQNAEVGDPAFYESVLKPVVERLDAAAARVSADMDDATLDELAKGALPGWHNFAFDIQRLRADYLLRTLVDREKGKKK